MVTKKPCKRSPPHRTTWSSWSSGMSALSNDSEGQQNASAFADTHIESVCVLDIDSDPYSYRMSQVICTIGPASQDPDLLMEMAISGMTVARLDLATLTREFHQESIRLLREVEEKRGRPICIALDTRGTSITTGVLKEGTDAEIQLKSGQTVVLTTEDKYKNACDKSHIWVDYDNIINVALPSHTIFIDNDSIMLNVQDISGDAITCVVEGDCKLGSSKTVHLPGIKVELPALTEADREDVEWGLEAGVDVIFASFVRNVECVKLIREVLGERGKNIKVFAKIENNEGISNFDDIIKVVDGIMVGRRSLGAEIPLYKVFVAQKMITARCNRAHKPVICAAQMLESMCKQSRPTRAEACDVANAVIDGADCLMLSLETSEGLFPVETVKVMHFVAREAEAAIYHRQVFDDLRALTMRPTGVKHTTAMAAVEASVNSMAACIIVLKSDENTAQQMAAYRPRCPILAVTSNIKEARFTRLYRGILPLIYESPPKEDWSDEMDERMTFAIEFAMDRRIARAGSEVIIVMSWFTKERAKINTVRIYSIPRNKTHYKGDDENTSALKNLDEKDT
ncbi:Pyruvate kinase PKM [Lamellibrachia satsuma]|nr:Pyruvate kinase PKM [Lamellibrachia satsuma]